MLQGVIIWLVTLLLTILVIGGISQWYPIKGKRFMLTLFVYHSAMALSYYLYALASPSDSKAYFVKASTMAYGPNWFDYFGISTRFVDFITFFLVNDLGFTYESCMAFFSWLGFLGFLSFYIFFVERIKVWPRIYGLRSEWLLFLLPNIHFWSASLGKGSLIFFGMGLFFFALNKPLARILPLILGGWIVFQIRPHIFYVVLIALALGYTFSTKGVAIGYRVVVLSISIFLLYNIYDDVAKLSGLEDESLFDPFFSHRASELTKATSGIDITHYNIPEKLFAFWFRPLFFDAPGILGFIVSFENLFYLIVFVILLRPRAMRYIWRSDAITKTCLFTFLGVSFALAQISGNLGLAMRQKSQVMMLMLFVILKYLEHEKLVRIGSALRAKTQRRSIPEPSFDLS